MTDETPSRVQQSGIGISSTVCIRLDLGMGSGDGDPCGATVTDIVGISGAGKSMSGWVFFIWTPGFAGGSGSTVIRAVSFFGDDDGDE